MDGYTQPGATPNSNPILGGNNAQLKIVLDSTGTDSAPNPVNPALPLRRSTRLDFPLSVGNTGYGTSENCILGAFGADNVTIRGLSFIARHTDGSDGDPAIYAVALVNQATNARVQGCWFGLEPNGTGMADVKPASAAVAAFRWRIGGDVFSARAIIGTDGDGSNDRAEFNVMVGCHIALALELPGARVSGNYLNVFPDGVTFVDVDAIHQQLLDTGRDEGDSSVETFENGRVTIGTLIGTDGDGVSDADERNIFGHSVYDHDIEFYSDCREVVIAGNYFGVGVDGVSTAPLSTNMAPDCFSLGGSGSVRVGSNGDGVGDDLEGNLIANLPGSRYLEAGASVLIATRRNQLVNNSFNVIPFADGANATYLSYYGGVVANAAQIRPVLGKITGGQVTGTFAAPNMSSYVDAIIDLYVVDPAALGKDLYAAEPMVHPMTWLASYKDNGAGDLDPADNAFKLDLSGFSLSETTYVAVAVSYSMDTGAFNVARAVTSPMSNPVSARPELKIKRVTGTDNYELSWLGAQGAFVPQTTLDLVPATWAEMFDVTVEYTYGRNHFQVPNEFFDPSHYYRLSSE